MRTNFGIGLTKRWLAQLETTALPAESRARSREFNQSSAAFAVAAGFLVVVWSALVPHGRVIPMLAVALGCFVLGGLQLTVLGRLPVTSAATLGVALSVLASIGTALDFHVWTLGLLILFLASLHSASFAPVKGLLVQLATASTGFIAASLVQSDRLRALVAVVAVVAALACFAFAVLTVRRLLETRVEDLHRRSHEHQAISQLSQRALSEPDIDALIRDAVDIIADTLAVGRAIVSESLSGHEVMMTRACFGTFEDSPRAISSSTPTRLPGTRCSPGSPWWLTISPPRPVSRRPAFCSSTA